MGLREEFIDDSEELRVTSVIAGAIEDPQPLADFSFK
jgi:hypothetical protein